MAGEAKLPGYEWLLFMKTATDTNYEPLACLTTSEMDDTTDEIDTTSKCDNGGSSSIAGVKTYKMTASGYTIDDGGISKKSFPKLFKISKSKENVSIRWAKAATPAASDYYYEGTGLITSLKQTAEVKDTVKFDIEVSIQGMLNIAGSY